MEWIENDKIYKNLEKKSEKFFSKLGNKVCVSENYDYCLLLQTNEAWYTENEGWRDSNSKPLKNKESRLTLNFFKVNGENKSWFKIFTPLKYNNYKLNTLENNSYQILSDNECINGIFNDFDSLMWDFMTGNAEMESEIENKFKMIERK